MLYCFSGYCQPKRLIGELNSEGKLNCQNSHFLFQLLKHYKNHSTKQGYIYCFVAQNIIPYNCIFSKIKLWYIISNTFWYSIPWVLGEFLKLYTIVSCSFNQHHHTSEFQIRGKLVFHKTRICKQIVLSWKIWTNLPWNAFSTNNYQPNPSIV